MAHATPNEELPLSAGIRTLSVSKTNLRVTGIASILLGATHGSPIVSSIFVMVGLILALWSVRTRMPLIVGSEHRWAAVASAVLAVGLLGRPCHFP